MWARCGLRVRGTLAEVKRGVPQDGRFLQTKSLPRRAAAATKRQRSVNVNDLPLRARDSEGKPIEALGDFTSRPTTVTFNQVTKGKEKAEVESIEQVFQVPRLNELGRE
jgi:hypothetical protein